MSEKRKYPHFGNCRCGDGEKELEKDHLWYVNAPQHSNCFWTYFKHNKRSHTLAEVADLIGVSISAITAIERRAMRKLKKRMKHYAKE